MSEISKECREAFEKEIGSLHSDHGVGKSALTVFALAWQSREDEVQQLRARIAELEAKPAPVPYPWTARLANASQRTPIERIGLGLSKAIEGLGAHPLLTEAMAHVDNAVNTLGAWHDQGEPGKPSTQHGRGND